MADRAVLEATTRTLTGKKVKQIRRLGRIPATVYGHKVQSVSIDVDARAFRQIHTSAGDNQLIDLVLDGKHARPVLIHTTQIDPRRNTAMHVEFYQANLKEKLSARIPIILTGEAPAARHGLMVLNSMDSIEMECLPTDLPHDISVDISNLSEVGDAIHVRDLELDREKCALKMAEDEIVVHVVAPQVVREDTEEGEGETAASPTPEAGPAAEATGDGESSSE
jgi:large subunit ribosomal protein L25